MFKNNQDKGSYIKQKFFASRKKYSMYVIYTHYIEYR